MYLPSDFSLNNKYELTTQLLTMRSDYLIPFPVSWTIETLANVLATTSTAQATQGTLTSDVSLSKMIRVLFGSLPSKSTLGHPIRQHGS